MGVDGAASLGRCEGAGCLPRVDERDGDLECSDLICTRIPTMHGVEMIIPPMVLETCLRPILTVSMTAAAISKTDKVAP